jgi:hypothetical protein
MEPRSTFWVVSTHILTVGLAFPAVAGIAEQATITYCGIRDPLVDAGIRSVFGLFASFAGVYYSLNYLRTAATHKQWTDCTTPSIVAFVILAAINLGLSVYAMKERTVMAVCVLSVSYIGATWAVSAITAAGFARLSSQEPLPDTSRSPRPRLLWAATCFAASFVVGVGIAMYFDRQGLAPHDDWQRRITTGLVLAVIGALLGAISGPARR